MKIPGINGFLQSLTTKSEFRNTIASLEVIKWFLNYWKARFSSVLIYFPVLRKHKLDSNYWNSRTIHIRIESVIFFIQEPFAWKQIKRPWEKTLVINVPRNCLSNPHSRQCFWLTPCLKASQQRQLQLWYAHIYKINPLAIEWNTNVYRQNDIRIMNLCHHHAHVLLSV